MRLPDISKAQCKTEDDSIDIDITKVAMRNEIYFLSACKRDLLLN